MKVQKKVSVKNMTETSLSKEIKLLADSSGIDALGFAGPSEFKGYALKHSKRRNPKLSLLDAKTIIVAGIYIGGLTLPAWTDSWYGRTSRLYLSGFFLDVVKPLQPIAAFLEKEGYQAIICESKTSEGSILPLKLSAIRAGLGWQGKHSLLISKKFGTFLALGGILTNADFPHNEEEEPNHCGKCDKCQAACPMGALDQPHVLNVDKCLSYLLQSEDLPEKARLKMENRIGDCEVCQNACPWNKKHLERPLATKLNRSFQKKIEVWENLFYLPNLNEQTEKGYREVFGKLNTSIPYEIFHRNVLIAIENAKSV